MSQTIYFNSKQHGFPFKVTPLESYALSYPWVPCFNSLQKEFFRDATQLHRYSSPDALYVFKMGFFDNLLELREKKNVTQSNIRWIGRLFQYGNVPLCQELLDAQHTQSYYFSDLSKSSEIIFQTVLFHVQLSCDHLNSQLKIATHHLSYPLDIDLCPNLSSFTLTRPSLDLLCHSQRPVYMGLSLSTYWNISSVCDGVFPNRDKNFRFIRFPVPITERLQK